MNRSAHVAQGIDAGRHAQRQRRWWWWTRRLLTTTFFVLVATLLVWQARAVQWDEVFTTIRRYPLATLMGAAGFAAASHLLYSSYDLLGRHYTDHRLRTPTVMAVTFISYAFNLNLGSLVGGIAFRYRLYSRLGLATADVTRVLTMSMLTNWLGYLLLAGTVFAWSPLALPPDWKLDSGGLRLLGYVLLALAGAYLVLCATSRRRSWTLRGHEVTLPSLRFALLQLAMSSSNWLLMAGAMYTLLQQKIAFTDVLSVLLVAAVAGVITHVPAGLGVLEAIFAALLSHQLPLGQLLAALLTYRALYYLAPLVAASVLYVLVEARAKRS